MTPLPSVDHLALVKERGWNRFLPAFNYLGNHYVLLSFLFSALITFLIYFDYRFPIPLYNPGEIAKEDIRAPIEFSYRIWRRRKINGLRFFVRSHRSTTGFLRRKRLPRRVRRFFATFSNPEIGFGPPKNLESTFPPSRTVSALGQET